MFVSIKINYLESNTPGISYLFYILYFASILLKADAIEMLPIATDKTINDLSKWSKEAIYLLGH